MAKTSEKQVSEIRLKLLVDTTTNKVLFAEAGKEFVDFIMHLMSLPLGSVVKLLSQDKMVGCLGDLYKSVESLNTQYFHSDINKNCVLNPKSDVNVPLLALTDAPTTTTITPAKFYRCGCSSHVTDHSGTPCPNCRYGMCTVMTFVAGSTNAASSSSSESGGYVKGFVTYMVMDNLELNPMSTISSITLINKFKVKDVSALEDKEVELGLKEGLAILKASLETKAVLTSVFLGNKI